MTSTLGSKLSKKWWQGIGAIAGLAAIVITLLLALGDKPEPGDISISTSAQTGCNVAGEGNTVDCPIVITPAATKSLAGLRTIWSGSSTWYFDGPAKDLPEPPDYPATEWNGHCDEWLPWLSTQEDFYVTNAGVQLLLASGQGEQVIVRSITAKILSYKETGPERTTIFCTHGAGGDVGDVVNIDTTKPETKVLFENGEEAVMPPASIELQDLDYSGAQVNVSGSADRLYTGILEITADINGVEKHFSYGSTSQPVRWMGDPESLFASEDLADALDWDIDDQRWKPWGELTPEDDEKEVRPPSSRQPSRDGAAAAIVRDSDGDSCNLSSDSQSYGSYPTAVCRIWSETQGLRVDYVLPRGAVEVACQADLGIPNPRLTAGQSNTWWIWVQSSEGPWAWFPETAIAEGASDQPVNGVAVCRLDE